jgi:hypothetical protein
LPRGADKELPIEKTQIAKMAEEFLDEEISSLSEQLGTSISGGKALNEEIKELGRDWEKDQVKEDEIRKKFKFVAGDYKNIYAQMTDYRNTLEGRLGKMIETESDSCLENTENLLYTMIFLERLSEYKENLLTLWRNQGLGENIQELNRAVDEEVLGKKWSFALDRAKRNEDSIWALADKTKIFFLYQILKSVNLSEERSGASYFTKEQLVKIKDGVIKTRDRVLERRNELEKMLTAPNMPIRMIWRNGSFDKDLKDIEGRFKNVSYRELEVGGQEGLKYFLQSVKIEDGKPKDQHAWSHLISLFQNWINRKVSGDASIRINDLIEKEGLNDSEFANRAKALLLPLDKGGYTSNAERGVPAVMLHKSEVEMKSLKEKGGLAEFAPCVLEELSHSMLFLQEQIGISPLIDLIHRKDMEDARYYIVKDAYGRDTLTPKRWEELVDPYETEKAIIRPTAQKVAEVILNLLIDWEMEPKTGELKPLASNLGSFALNIERDGISFQIDRGDVIVVAGKVYQEIKALLPSVLEQNRSFLERIVSLLAEWKPDDSIINKSRDRWKQMKYSEDNIETLEKNYKELASYIQKEKRD